MRRLLARLALVIAGLLLGLALAEAALRSPWGPADGYENLLAEAPRLYDLSLFKPDPELGMVLQPGAEVSFRTPEFNAEVRVNALGMRGPEPGPKAPEELRVIAVGDSFTLGLQVAEEDHFAEALSIGLTEDLTRPVRLLNAGVDGFGTQAATRYASRLVDRAQADGLLLFFFLGNDLWDNQTFGQGTHSASLKSDRGGGLTDFLERRFALAYYLRVLRQARALDPSTPRGRRHRQEAAIFVEPESLERSMRATRVALKGFGALCRSKDLRCAVAVVPPMFVLDERRARATFSALGLSYSSEHLDGPAQAVIAASPVPAVDLGPALRAAAAQERQYFPFDGHWTEAGHATAAEALRPWLAEQWR